MGITIKSLFKNLSQSQLISLAQKIQECNEDITFDTTVSAQQLRSEMETCLRSNPQFMHNIPGLENVQEYLSWRDDLVDPFKKSQLLPRDQDKQLKLTVSSAATTPTTEIWSPTASMSAVTVVSGSVTTGVITTIASTCAASQCSTTTSTTTATSISASGMSTTASPIITAGGSSGTLTTSDITSIVATVLQHTSGQQSQLLQQLTSQMDLLSHCVKGRQDQTDPGIGAFLKQAHQKSLTFGGSSGENLHRFINKVETLLDGFRISEADKVRAVGDLFNSSAEVWFESKKRDLATWTELKQALKFTYLPKHHESDLRRKILTTRQEYKEKVSHFISKIRVMNSELEQPLSDSQLLPIVMTNLHHSYFRLIGMREKDYCTWDELESACLRAECILVQQDRVEKSSYSARQDKSYLYAAEVSESQQPAELEPVIADIEAVRVTNNRELICYNCREAGHKHSECSKAKKFFCYKCGRQGVTSTVCPCNTDTRFSEEQLTALVEKVVKDVLAKQLGN